MGGGDSLLVAEGLPDGADKLAFELRRAPAWTCPWLLSRQEGPRVWMDPGRVAGGLPTLPLASRGRRTGRLRLGGLCRGRRDALAVLAELAVAGGRLAPGQWPIYRGGVAELQPYLLGRVLPYLPARHLRVPETRSRRPARTLEMVHRWCTNLAQRPDVPRSASSGRVPRPTRNAFVKRKRGRSSPVT
jgi:hypothetical protein